MTPDRVAELVAPFFTEGGILYGRYSPSEEPFSPVPGGAAGWEASIYPTGSVAPRIIRVYPLERDGGELVRAHWRNETRALLRVSSTDHPSLPRFREGMYLEAERIGFVIIDEVGRPVVGDHPVSVLLARSPLAAFRRWFALLEATMLVQDEGLIHRSISPMAACALRDVDATIVLDGFQMSAFVSTWLSGNSAEAQSWRGNLDGPTLACLSPERAGPLLGQPRKYAEGLRSDIFGLGMLGALWFAPPESNWASEIGPGTYVEEAHRAAVAEVRANLANSFVPAPLRRLLATMTEFDPANRLPGARVAYEEAAKLYGTVLRALSEREEADPSPRHIYYLKETIERLYAENRTRTPPQHPDYEEYNEYIARDLDAGSVVWSPDGFTPWATSATDARANQARIVLLGREYAYFAQLRDQGSQDETDRALVIKYALPVHRARELRGTPRAVPMPAVRLEFFAAGSRGRPHLAGPRWSAIVDAVRVDASQLVRPPIVRAARWLLGAQQALLAAREYHFERDIEDPNAVILTQLDDSVAVDQESEEGAFLSVVNDGGVVVPMGVLFERIHRDAEESDDSASFEFFEKRGEHPSFVRLVFEKKLDDHTVRFRSDPLAIAATPKHGYIRPLDPGRFVLQRQRRAVAELEARQRHLSAQLSSPTGVRLRDEGPAPSADDATAVLVHQVRETWPFFAIQGPPGTGKTFVAGRVIQEVLRDDPFARVLVSAQSHHAVDNLLAEVARKLPVGTDTILLRVATDRTRVKVAPDCEQHLAVNLLERLRDAAKRVGPGSGNLAQLSKRWRRAVNDRVVDADLAQRLLQAASVVFASCAGAGSREFENQGVSFDWVVAEEAARGWITEFLVPLVRGTRWLMLGDQAQLPAFGRNELDVVLTKDVELRRTEAATGTPVDLRWRDTFLRHFAHVVDSGKNARVPTACTLTLQRRMHPDIGQLIGRAFYGGKLEHDEITHRPHGLTVKGIDPSTAFVWVDTTSLGQAAWERGLVNDAETRLMGYLLSHGLTAIRHAPDVAPLFVLSPYRAQVRAISSYVKQVERDVIRTVDSVQGRQAEVVVVSLVRNNPASDPRASVGFLAEPERVNVMLSRARRLLVIVGSLAHFERFAIPHWHEIAKHVRGDNRFLVDASTTGFRLGGSSGSR